MAAKDPQVPGAGLRSPTPKKVEISPERDPKAHLGLSLSRLAGLAGSYFPFALTRYSSFLK